MPGHREAPWIAGHFAATGCFPFSRWNARRIDLLLERGGAFEFLPGPDFDGRQPSGSPSVVTARLECIRMPQTACDLRRPALSRPLLMLFVIPIAFRVLPRGELGRVMENKDDTIGGNRAFTRRLKVTGQDVRLADPVVGEKSDRPPWCSPNLGRPAECFAPWRSRAAPPACGGACSGARPQKLSQQVRDQTTRRLLRPLAPLHSRFCATQGITVDSRHATISVAP